MIFLYFLFLFSLFLKFKKRDSVAFFLLAVYLSSSFLSLLGEIYYPSKYDINDWAILYYIICIIMSLLPFLIFGKYSSSSFLFNDRYIRYLSIVLISFGLISLYYSIQNLFTISTVVNNLRDVRQSYYQGYELVESSNSLIEILSNWVNNINYLSLFFSVYFLTRKRFIYALLLFIASLSMPINKMCIGEREATLIWVANFTYSIIFFREAIPSNILLTFKKVSLVILIPMVVFFVAMTISRFEDEDGGILKGLFVYGGEQCQNFSYFFTHLDEQKLGGKLNFGYLFPLKSQLQGPINDYISSPIYLNVFGGIPGSLFLDFGYFTIFYIMVYSLISFILLKQSKQYKYSFWKCIFLYFNFQILFTGVFYYDFTTKYALVMHILLYSSLLFYNLILRNFKVIKK